MIFRILLVWLLMIDIFSCTTGIIEQREISLGYMQLKYNITRTIFDFANENQIISPSLRQQKNYSRIIAIGSVYGDREQLINAMNSVGICDANGTWIASNTILIQNGDILSPNVLSFNALQLIIEWGTDAPKYNSLCLMIMGKYESQYLDQYYSDPVSATADVAQQQHTTINIPQMQRLDSYAFHALGSYLRNLPIIRVLGTTVFVHSGVSDTVATEVYGDIRYLNALALVHYKYGGNIEHYLELIEDCVESDGYSLMHERKEHICVMLEQTMVLIANYVEFPLQHMVISIDERENASKGETVRCDNNVLYMLGAVANGLYWEQYHIKI